MLIHDNQRLFTLPLPDYFVGKELLQSLAELSLLQSRDIFDGGRRRRKTM